MKNRIIKILVVVGIIIVVGCLIKFGTEIYEQKKYENELIDALNNDTMYDFITEDEMSIHKYAKMEVPSEYNITSVINDYIDNINICIINKKNNDDEKYKKVEVRLIGDNLIVNGFQRKEEFDYIKELITDEDIEDYNAGIFKNKLIKRLKPIIKHKEENGKINWYINNDCDKIIELPYNVYADFKYSDKKNTGVKKVTKIRFLDKENKMCHIEYELNDGNIKEKEFRVIRTKINGKYKCAITNFNSIYYDITQQPLLTFGQHDYDAYEKKWLEEHDSSQNTTPEGAWNGEDPECHSEWKEVFDGDGEIGLYHYLDDNRWEYSFGMLKENKKGIITGFILPYTESMTMDEAVERFLNDEEQVKKAKALWE